MTVVPHDEAPFAGRIATDRVGALAGLRRRRRRQRVRRTAAHIARSPEPFVAVGVQMKGRTVLVQGDHEDTANQNDLFVYDTARPYSLDHP